MAQNNFAEAFKVFTDFKAPVYDFNQLFSIGRRNLEAFSAANQAIAEGAQAVARRQAEVSRNNTEEAIQLFRDIYSSKNPEASAAKQAEFVKQSFETTLANLREMFEMASKSNVEASEVLSKRISDAMAEFNKAYNNNASGGKKSSNA